MSYQPRLVKSMETRKEFEKLFQIVKLGNRFAIVYKGMGWGYEFIKDWGGELKRYSKIIKFNKIENAKRFLKEFIDKRKSYYQD